jgi:Mrp family chromosome partitioning ATPase
VQLLNGTEPITKERMAAVVKRGADLLSVLTSGAPDSTGADLFRTKRIAELVEVARQEYDLILIDTAPLLSAPETRILARLADWSILVLRAGRTTADAAIAARQQMADDRIALLGTILNDYKRYGSAYGYRS